MPKKSDERTGPVPDGTPQYDDNGRCLFCNRRDDHVHPEPRPDKTPVDEVYVDLPPGDEE